MRRALRFAVLVVLLAPGATALDLLPDATVLGAREGSVVVRAKGVLRVAADAPVQAAIAEGPFVDAPATLDVSGAPAWHGLAHAVEVRLRRDDASRDARVELDDGATGVVIEWPAERRVPSPSAPLVLAAVLGFALAPKRAGARDAGRRPQA